MPAFITNRIRYVNDSGANSFFVVVTNVASLLLRQQDRFVIAQPQFGAPTYTLPASPVSGQRHTIIDDLGFASPSFVITVAGNGHNINSREGINPTYSIGLPKRCNTFEYNGSTWDVVSMAGPITFLEGGAATQRVSWPLLQGIVSTPLGSSTPQIVGSAYFDPLANYAARTPDTGFVVNITLKAILATTNAANTATMDLIDVNNVLGNGVGATVPGSTVTTTSTNQAYVTASPALSITTPSGIFSARLWLNPTSAGQQAIAYMAKIDFDYAIFAP